MAGQVISDFPSFFDPRILATPKTPYYNQLSLLGSEGVMKPVRITGNHQHKEVMTRPDRLEVEAPGLPFSLTRQRIGNLLPLVTWITRSQSGKDCYEVREEEAVIRRS